MNQQLYEMMKDYLQNINNKHLRQDLVDCLTSKELVEYETQVRKELGLDTSHTTFSLNPNFN